jgi:hypothetical protein
MTNHQRGPDTTSENLKFVGLPRLCPGLLAKSSGHGGLPSLAPTIAFPANVCLSVNVFAMSLRA